MAVDRSWDPSYLQEQYKAMAWLAKQGMTPVEMSNLTWGAVDEADKVIKINKKVVFLQADLDNDGIVRRDEYEKTFKVPLKGTECEKFFLKSTIWCGWMFTREKPRSWRKEKSVASLFTPVEIEKIIQENSGKLDNTAINALTSEQFFDTIEVSKLNITKMKTKELEKEATMVEE